MTSKTNRIVNEFLDFLIEKASDKPNGAFTIPLEGLLWASIDLKATTVDPVEIKRGLINYAKEHTQAFSRANQQSDVESPTFNLSRPTRQRYLRMLAQEIDADYNNKTFDWIFNVLKTARRNRFTLSQFWWSFCRDYYLDGLAMLADPSDPFQKLVKAFWQVQRPDGFSIVMAKLNILRFAVVFGSALRLAFANPVRSQTKAYVLNYMKIVKKAVSNQLFANLAELDQALEA